MKEGENIKNNNKNIQFRLAFEQLKQQNMCLGFLQHILFFGFLILLLFFFFLLFFFEEIISTSSMRHVCARFLVYFIGGWINLGRKLIFILYFIFSCAVYTFYIFLFLPFLRQFFSYVFIY